MEISIELPFRPQLIGSLLVLVLLLFPQALAELDPVPFHFVYHPDLLKLVQPRLF